MKLYPWILDDSAQAGQRGALAFEYRGGPNVTLLLEHPARQIEIDAAEFLGMIAAFNVFGARDQGVSYADMKALLHVLVDTERRNRTENGLVGFFWTGGEGVTLRLPSPPREFSIEQASFFALSVGFGPAYARANRSTLETP